MPRTRRDPLGYFGSLEKLLRAGGNYPGPVIARVHGSVHLDQAIRSELTRKFWNAGKFTVWGHKMKDQSKTRPIQIQELDVLKQRIAELEQSEWKWKREKEELKKSEARFRSYFDLNLYGIAVTSPEKGWIQVNNRICFIMGYSRDEIVRMTWTEITHPDDLAADLEQFSRVLSGEIEQYNMEKRFIRKNGSVVWTNLSVGCVRNVDGSVDHIVAVIQDITSSKLAEKALKESEEKYRTLFENAGEAIFVAQDGRVVFLNPMTTLISGYSGEEFTSRPFTDFIHADDRDMIVDRHIRRLRGEDIPRSYDFRALHKNGGFLWVQLDTILISWQGKPATLNFMTDITDRKRAEEEVHRVNTLLNSIVENIPNMIFLKDARELRFTRFNRAGEELLGHSRGDLLGKNDYDFFPKEQADFFTQKDREVLRGKEIVDIQEEPLQTRNKGERTLHTKKVPILNANGEPEYLMGISEDITDRKQAADELRASEEKYRLIFEHSPLGLLSFDEKGAIVACNNNFVEIIGSSREKLIGLNMLKLPNEKVVLAVKNALKGSPGFYEGDYSSVTAKKITPVRCLFAPMDSGGGRISGGVGIIEDITDRKQAQEALRERESFLQKIFDILPVGLWFVDKNGNLMRGNPAGVKIWGAEPHVAPSEYGVFRARRLPSGKEIAPDDWALVHTIKYGMTIVDELLEIDAFDGKKKVILNYTAPVMDDHGEIQGAIVLNQDITDRKRAEEQLQQTLESLRKSVNTTVQAMVSAVESRDPYTAGHQIRSANLARAIATEMGLPKEKIDGIRMAGSIHDIGKLSIPSEILTKPTKLTNLEFSLIKEHSQKGFEMLKNVESSWPLAQIVYQHHERMDGSGYPRQLKGKDIIIEARILAVADVVEAMASHRPYRAAIGIDAALEEIAKNKGHLYDPDAVDACLKLFREKGFQLEGE